MNKTGKTVVDGKKLDNEQLGSLTRRHDEIKRRINEGTLGFNHVISSYQAIAENRFWLPAKNSYFFTVTGDGYDYQNAIKKMREEGFIAACDELKNCQFINEKGKKYLLALMHCDEFAPGRLETSLIQKEAMYRGWIPLPADFAPLVCRKFTWQKLKSLSLTRLAMMHDPILINSRPNVLSFVFDCNSERGGLFFSRCCNWDYFEENRWGFIFLVPNFLE